MSDVSEIAVWCGRRASAARHYDEKCVSQFDGHVGAREVTARAHRDIAAIEAVSLLVVWMNEEGK